MLALVCLTIVMVALLGVLVVGLLRSLADFLRALHSLGAGVGDPAGAHAGSPEAVDFVPGPDGASRRQGRPAHAPGQPLVIGPSLPPERDTSSVPDVAGVTPGGDAQSVAVGGAAHHTLLAFLSSGCTTCTGFWDALAAPASVGLPSGVRPVVVTKGIEFESPTELGHRGALAAGVPVIMSTEAWEAYEVPGSPFFVLVDGPGARRIGEGSAMQMEQIARMVRQALDEAGVAAPAGGPPAPASGPVIERGDRMRESENDRHLLAAGILPGHRSLYPTSLEVVVPSTSPAETAADPPAVERP